MKTPDTTTAKHKPFISLLKYVLLDILQNRIIIGFTLFLGVAAYGLFALGGESSKGLVGLLNIILIVSPLVSLVFATIHMYNSSEFIELLAAQPVKRSTIILSLYLGIGIALVLAHLIGLGIPILIFSPNIASAWILINAVLLSLIFTSIAVLISVLTRDKARGIGIVLLVWFLFSLLYDAFVLFILFSFSDYPLEKPMVILTCLNPVDLARVTSMLKLDIAALMGYTGAVFQKHLGANTGVIIGLVVNALWIAVPLYFAVRRFIRKDL